MDHTDGAVGVLDPVDAAPAAPDPEPGRADPTAGETVFTRQVRYITAICSFGGALLHILAMIDHRGFPTLARSFLAIAAIQIVWGVLLIVEPRKIFVLLGGLATAGAIAVRVLLAHEGHLRGSPGSRTSKASDGATSSRSSTNCSRSQARRSCCCPRVRSSPPASASRCVPIAVFAVFAMAVMAVLYAATHAGGH